MLAHVQFFSFASEVIIWRRRRRRCVEQCQIAPPSIDCAPPFLPACRRRRRPSERGAFAFCRRRPHSLTQWIERATHFLTSLFFPPSREMRDEAPPKRRRRRRQQTPTEDETKRGGGRSRFFWGRRKLAGRSLLRSLHVVAAAAAAAAARARHHCSIGAFASTTLFPSSVSLPLSGSNSIVPSQ